MYIKKNTQHQSLPANIARQKHAKVPRQLHLTAAWGLAVNRVKVTVNNTIFGQTYNMHEVNTAQ